MYGSLLMGMSINPNRPGMIAPRLPSNWFWWVGSVVHRFYCLEASPKGSYLERFLMYIFKGFMTVFLGLGG